MWRGTSLGRAEWKAAALGELPSVHVLKVRLTFILLASNPKGGQKVPALLLAVPYWDALTKVRGKTDFKAHPGETTKISVPNPGEPGIPKSQGKPQLSDQDQTSSAFPPGR